MKRTFVTVAITVAVVIVLAAGLLLFVVYTGAYNVAATASHAEITEWALNTLQRSSVSRRARDIEEAPPADSADLAAGFHHFHAMCLQCHGAPGVPRGELGQGLTPTPPRLEEEVHEWTDAELFWIAKHGIRLAGMPAFGPTHSDRDLWGIVAFTRRLETMTEEEYAALARARAAGMQGEEGEAGEEAPPGGHPHGPGTAPHSH